MKLFFTYIYKYFLKVLFSEIGITIYSKIVGYHTSIDIISAYRWHKIEEGELKYLYKRGMIEKIPKIFNLIFRDMFYQFEKIDPLYFRKMHKLAYLRSMYVTTKNIRFLNDANTLSNSIEKKNTKKISHTLNEKVNFIESTFNSIGSIDVHKISASRFYALLDMAIKKAENGNN